LFIIKEHCQREGW